MFKKSIQFSRLFSVRTNNRLKSNNVGKIRSLSSDSLRGGILEFQVKENVGFVTLNRPDKMNACTMDTFEGLIELAREIDANNDVRAVVLHGNGKCFSSGIDLSSFSSTDVIHRAFDKPDAKHEGNVVQLCSLVWQRLRVPVVAALHGVVYGAGLQISLGADIRYAHSQTKFSIMEAKHSLIPDMGITVTARNIVRHDYLKYLTYTGAVIDARQAKEFGLTTFVTEQDPLEAASKLASQLATQSPKQLESAKQLYRESFIDQEQERHSLTLEEQLQSKLLNDPQFLKNMAKMMKK